MAAGDTSRLRLATEPWRSVHGTAIKTADGRYAHQGPFDGDAEVADEAGAEDRVELVAVRGLSCSCRRR